MKQTAPDIRVHTSKSITCTIHVARAALKLVLSSLTVLLLPSERLLLAHGITQHMIRQTLIPCPSSTDDRMIYEVYHESKRCQDTSVRHGEVPGTASALLLPTRELLFLSPLVQYYRAT